MKTRRKEYNMDKMTKEYNDIFLTAEDTWWEKLDELKEYINHNFTLPTYTSNEELFKWLQIQRSYEIRNEKMKEEWVQFMETHKGIFMEKRDIYNSQNYWVREHYETFDALSSSEKSRKLYKWGHNSQSIFLTRVIMDAFKCYI